MYVPCNNNCANNFQAKAKDSEISFKEYEFWRIYIIKINGHIIAYL